MRDLCDKVSRKDFEVFIETGEASEDLLDHIESCEKCGAETERCFGELAKDFDKLRDKIRKELEPAIEAYNKRVEEKAKASRKSKKKP